MVNALTACEQQRHAAFAMSKCECDSDEACRNLAALHDRLTAGEQRIAALEELLRTQPAESHTRMWQQDRRAILAKGETK